VPYHLNVLVDQELERALRAHATAAGLQLSQVVRDLLRHSLGVTKTTRDAGWREGYTRGIAEVQRTVQTALKSIKPPKS